MLMNDWFIDVIIMGTFL